MTDKYELYQSVSSESLDLRAPLCYRQNRSNPNIDRIIQKLIRLPLLHEDDHAYIQAEKHHAPFRTHQQSRLAELAVIYQELGAPEDMIVMICCEKYFPFLDTWLNSCDKNQISVRNKTLVFTMDLATHHQVKRLGIQSYYLDAEWYEIGDSALHYGDINFRSRVYYKNAVIADCLKLDANILFQDVDLIWFKDPLSFLNRQEDRAEIQIMYDGPNKLYYPFYANSGFIYIKNCDVSKAIFNTALRNSASIFKTGSHQLPLNRIFDHFHAHNLLNIAVLPQHTYLNGHLFNLESGVRPNAGNWQQDGIVFHYSWTGNCAQKLQKLSKFGFDRYNTTNSKSETFD